MDHFKVLIIGAGASGLAAAAKLLEAGFTDFIILEAQNRAGGRVNTTTVENFPIELGAEWIHGQTDNAVYNLAAKYGFANPDTDDKFFIQTKFFDTSGCQVNKDISVTLTSGFYNILYNDFKSLRKEDMQGSIGTYVDHEFQKLVDELRNTLNVDSKLFHKFLKTFELWENSIDGSDSWYATSLNTHSEYWECDGTQTVEWKNHRYDTLFNLLTREIHDQMPLDKRIIFEKEVIKIKWNKECKPNLPNVEVRCSDGSLYSADAILITCSLGVLKERAADMFFPSLPAKKLSFIQNFGFGTVDKIFLTYSDCWWGDDIDGFAFLWSEEERKTDSSGWLNGIICFHPVNNNWPVLRGWITAEAARVMESLSVDEIVNGINYLFNKFLGPSKNVPAVESCKVSRWYTNPHFRGSYSCRMLKSEKANVWPSNLAESVSNIRGHPILFFGGEATHDHYYSTVHGAVESGWREAEKLLRAIQNGRQMATCVEVAIVGAGISGLAAAKTLLENGVTDIIILEAQSQPGGRICSILIDDYYLELGAQWIHGEKNEVFTICRENDLLTNEYSTEGEGLYFRENGEQIDEILIKDVDDVIKNILENCETYVSSEQKVCRSIGEELASKFNEYLESCTQDTEEVKNIKRELFRWHVVFQLIDNSCSDLFNLSAKAWGHFKFCGGNDYVNFKNGYSSLVKTILNCIPKNVLLCDTVVQRINWREEINIWEESKMNFPFGADYSVVITTKRGETVYCKYVIVTASLGCLKRNYKSMFHPALPNYLSEAIEFLDFGVMDKIFLIYETPWWDYKVKGFQLVWSDDVADESKQYWGRCLTGFDVIFKDKPILLGWVGAEGAKALEQIPEEEVGRQATEILRKFTGNQAIPLPKRVIRTQWWSNEYVRGAYSHITVKCDESEISCHNLAKPVYSTVRTQTETFQKPTILLAGESTHKNYYSTVHGAFESGQSQSQVILEHIKNQNKKFLG